MRKTHGGLQNGTEASEVPTDQARPAAGEGLQGPRQAAQRASSEGPGSAWSSGPMHRGHAAQVTECLDDFLVYKNHHDNGLERAAWWSRNSRGLQIGGTAGATHCPQETAGFRGDLT